MKKFFSALLLFSSAVIGSSDELTQHRLRSVSVALEDVTSAHADANILDDVLPRELKKKKKRPKVPKKPKSAKGLATTFPPSTQPTEKLTSQPSVSSQPTAPCAAISDQKDALLALKAGFTNGGTELSDWVTTTDPCTGPWTGITCDGSDVTQINLCK
jgi:hypothetical protein